MDTDVSTGKKKRPLLWIILVALIIAIGVLGWQAQSLIPQAGPAEAPAPVIAKVPPMPPPIPIQAPEFPKGPMSDSQSLEAPNTEADGSPAQPSAGVSASLDTVAQPSEDSAPAPPTQTEATASDPGQGDGAEKQPVSQFSSTQAAAPNPIQATAVEKAQPAPLNTPAESDLPVSPQATSEAPQTAPATQEVPEPDKRQPFTLQVGAFRTKTYALDKKTALDKRGYATYIFEIADTKKRIWYTVRFGHFATRDQAAQALSTFKNKEGMDGIISRSDAI